MNSDSQDNYITSHIVYNSKFSCCCKCLGRNDGILTSRVTVHIQKWLVEDIHLSNSLRNLKNLGSFFLIARHLPESERKPNLDKFFNLIYKSIHSRLIGSREVNAIKYFVLYNYQFDCVAVILILGPITFTNSLVILITDV